MHVRPPATTEPMIRPDSTASTLCGRWLVLARVVWVAVAVLAVGLFAAGVPARYAELRAVCADGEECAIGRLYPEDVQTLGDLGFSLGSYAAYTLTLEVGFVMVFFASAAVIFWRKSDEWVALLVALFLMTFGGTLPGVVAALPAAHPDWWLPVRFVELLGSVSLFLFFYLFPDGRFVPRWTRWLAVVALVWQMAFTFFPDSPFSTEPSNPLPSSGFVMLFSFVSTGLFAQIYRYRRVSSMVQRQQTKWVVFGVVAAMLVAFGLLLPFYIYPSLDQPGSLYNLISTMPITLSLLLIPLSIGVAILKYRLYDIDLIINRTLVYGVLTASIVGVYVVIVGGLAELLHTRGSLFASLLATGLVAVLFAPLRDLLQRSVNRLMYGEREDPYGVLSRLGQRLEATLEPHAVLPAVAETVAHALKLPHVTIELKRGEEYETVAEYGRPAGEPLCLPLVYGTETVGRIVLSPRSPGESFTPADRRLLDDLARQAGIAAYAVRLTTELQRSRERLVATREEERRRIRRDLHDGLGPALSSAMLKLSATRRLLPSGSPADDLIDEVRNDMRATVTDVRRLVYDLRPPTLDQLGLVLAIRDYAEQCGDSNETGGKGGLRVTLDAPEHLPPLPAAVEIAAYHIAREALTNAARHARARSCQVRLTLEGAPGRPELVLEITDDGVGLSKHHTAGVGLSSMRERAEELGGRCTIESLPEGGTRVLAHLSVGKK
jgi:signal transduction histidine kinase